VNTKGFTLTELLAVIIILSVLLVIAVPSVIISKNNALNALSNQEKENLKDAGIMVGIDLDDPTSDIYNCKSGSWIKTCTDCSCNSDSATVTVEALVDNGYFDDKGQKYKGSLTITKSDTSDTGYVVNINNVKSK